MEPPNPALIDMRHTKLKPEEAALIAGELVKPSWASRNEGIHERVSFEDTLWGFEMAGGAYYKTPLRVAYVRPGSRAEHACIKMGDTVLRINGVDTANLTLQEAHQLVIEAGINLKIVVTSPDDKVNAHYDYEDPIVEEPELIPEQLKQMELERVQRALARASRCRELQWPWVRRKWIIYRESNCFMVPSKYENKHRDKFPELPTQRFDYFYPTEKKKEAINKNIKDNVKTLNEEPLGEDEEYEEVEEEVQEDKEEEKNNIDQEMSIEEASERLGDMNIENNDNSSGENTLKLNSEDNSANDPDTGVLDNTSIEDSKRKDSNQSASSYELDNNNNHVAKHKDEKIRNEETESSDHLADNKMVNEIVENSNGALDDNLTKSDDDVIDSVLNDNIGSDLQNER